MRQKAGKIGIIVVGLWALNLPAIAIGQSATPVWRSGFENGFPGEFEAYDDGSYTSNGIPNSGRSEAWTIVGSSEFSSIYAGDCVYKGWISEAADSSHRAYPVLHTDIPTPLVNSFMVWLDVDFSQLDEYEWVHFGTWADNPNWEVHTMAVLANGRLEMAHLDYSYIGPSPQPIFPARKWVRLTVYLDYTNNGYVRVWQDGVPIFEGNFASQSGSLMRAHWGMYASGPVDNGVQYNDEIQIWTLDSPLSDLETEPESPYQDNSNTEPTDGGEAGSTSQTSDGGTAGTTGTTIIGDAASSISGTGGAQEEEDSVAVDAAKAVPDATSGDEQDGTGGSGNVGQRTDQNDLISPLEKDASSSQNGMDTNSGDNTSKRVSGGCGCSVKKQSNSLLPWLIQLLAICIFIRRRSGVVA